MFHDVETPFFGMMRYHVGYDAQRGEFAWLERAKPEQALTRFPNQYVLSPTALANRLLSRLSGCRVCPLRGAERDVTMRTIAGVDREGRRVVVVVNRSAEGRAVTVKDAPVSKAATLAADGLGSALPGSYALRELPVDGPAVPLPPWSVTALELPPEPGQG